MSIEGQGHFITIYFPGFVCFVLYWAKISGERLQDHWSSGFSVYLSIQRSNIYPIRENMCIWSKSKSSISISPSINLFIYLSFYLSIYLSIHLSIQRSNNNIYPIMKNMCIRSKSKHTLSIYLFLAHRSRRLTGELIGYPWIRRPSVVVVRRLSTFTNIFSSETAWPIKSKFYVEPPW